METSNLDKLATALSKAQSEIQSAHKNDSNPHFKSKFANLESVWEAVKGPLTSNGLSIAQTIALRGDKPVLVTTLLHTSGQTLVGEMPLIMARQDMQSLGAAITYARRFSLAAMMQVVQEDNDGEDNVDRRSQVSVVGMSSQPTKTIKQMHDEIPPPNDNDFPGESSENDLNPLSDDLGDLGGFTLHAAKKFIGRRLMDIPYNDLVNYLEFWRKSSTKVTGALLKELETIQAYVTQGK